MLEEAIRFAAAAHEGQRDKSGAPYIFHTIRVASTFSDETMQVIAVLHDVIEDTPCTHTDIERVFSIRIADTVLALSRAPHETYVEFIERVNANPTARLIKIADIRDNLRPGAGNLRQRYEQALRILGAPISQEEE